MYIYASHIGIDARKFASTAPSKARVRVLGYRAHGLDSTSWFDTCSLVRLEAGSNISDHTTGQNPPKNSPCLRHTKIYRSEITAVGGGWWAVILAWVLRHPPGPPGPYVPPTSLLTALGIQCISICMIHMAENGIEIFFQTSFMLLQISTCRVTIYSSFMFCEQVHKHLST